VKIYSAGDISTLVNGQLIGDEAYEVTGLSKIDEYTAHSLSYLANEKYKAHLHADIDRVVFVSDQLDITPPEKTLLIKVNDVYKAWAVVSKLYQSKVDERPQIDRLSSIEESANIGDQVHVGKFSIISRRVVIGSHTRILDQVYIGPDVKIGAHCVIHAGVKIYADTVIGDRVVIQANTVIGSDGFGYSFTDGAYTKIPHLGNVIIHDDVEIGANVCVDRAALGSTVVKRGAKLDNLIQIAHNVEVGEHVAMAAQSGVAGSSKVGAYSQVGGQTAISGHIQIAPGSRIQGKSGVSGDIVEPNKKWYGYPILGYWNYLRSYAIFKSLPQLKARIDTLEKRIRELSTGQKE